MPHATPTPRLMELFERSGDAHVGQMLVRLARLAAAQDRAQSHDDPNQTLAKSAVHSVRTEVNG